jgi:hypothetical protein
MNWKKIPRHLSLEAQGIWRLVFKTYSMDESGSVLLRQALDCYDRIEQARAEIEKNGLVLAETIGAGIIQRRLNPACRIEKENKTLFLQYWRALHIDLDIPLQGPGRPPLGEGKNDKL